MLQSARLLPVLLLLTVVGIGPRAIAQEGAAFEEVFEEGRAARQRYVDRIDELRSEISRRNARLFTAEARDRGEETRRIEMTLALARLHTSVGQYGQAVDLLKGEVGKAGAARETGVASETGAARGTGATGAADATEAADTTNEMRALLGSLYLRLGRCISRRAGQRRASNCAAES